MRLLIGLRIRHRPTLIFVKAHIESLPKIAALTQRQTEQVNLAANHQQYGGQQHTPEALSVAAQMGIDLGAPQV